MHILSFTFYVKVFADFGDIFGRIAGETVQPGDFCGDSTSRQLIYSTLLFQKGAKINLIYSVLEKN